jgi:hypothetical protein
MTPAPKRRWFRFSLRTLFVVVTLFVILIGGMIQVYRLRTAASARHKDSGVFR